MEKHDEMTKEKDPSSLPLELVFDKMTIDPCSIPLELVFDILTKVPAKPVLQFKCVSKEWLDIISNPNFIKRHVSQYMRANSCRTLIVQQGSTLYTLDYHNAGFRATKLYYPENRSVPEPGRMRIIGSCNGLLCIQYGEQISLYNPATQAHKIIPECNLGKEDFIMFYGKPQIVFAYDSISDDYKVLRFEKENLLSHIFGFGPVISRRVVLYSLSTNSWEIIENPPWEHESIQLPAVVANNSVFWMESNHKHIKSFDLFSRSYSEMPFPDKISPGYWPKLAVLGGRLHILTYYFDIWKLDNSGCWIRIFRCPTSQWNTIFELAFALRCWRSTSFGLGCSEDGRKILVARGFGPLNFICCDLESQEATMIDIPGFTSNTFSAILPWEGSLVPLSD